MISIGSNLSLRGETDNTLTCIGLFPSTGELERTNGGYFALSLVNLSSSACYLDYCKDAQGNPLDRQTQHCWYIAPTAGKSQRVVVVHFKLHIHFNELFIYCSGLLIKWEVSAVFLHTNCQLNCF